jgi:hypothetical protein
MNDEPDRAGLFGQSGHRLVDRVDGRRHRGLQQPALCSVIAGRGGADSAGEIVTRNAAMASPPGAGRRLGSARRPGEVVVRLATKMAVGGSGWSSRLRTADAPSLSGRGTSTFCAVL